MKRSFLVATNEKLLEGYRQLRLLTKQIVCQSYLISFCKSFSLNEYGLRILSSALLTEMFDLWAKS